MFVRRFSHGSAFPESGGIHIGSSTLGNVRAKVIFVIDQKFILLNCECVLNSIERVPLIPVVKAID